MKLHLVLIAAAVSLAAPLSSQPAPPDQLIAAQAEKMAVFDWMHGEWRGTAVRRGPEGEVTMIQTERVGPMLDGSLLVVEGRVFDGESG